ncbi:Aste57867_2701 [Aphanomyces stellatus]|uniref:Aste57867_2701 protein n=1 Tax=Aphanomyces stellatus TaxID=120398 RepID=A0A485KCE5_9STRA|nr:hypothetical protein As57867_002694 [Aphanomyces stellatus]VFT79894.1 Aste57867_2701 [Aphanomyces stellatus]
MRALARNEYLSSSPIFDMEGSAGFAHGALTKTRLGDMALVSCGISTNANYFCAVVFLVGYFLVLAGLTTLAYKCVHYRAPFPSDTNEAKDEPNDTMSLVMDNPTLNKLSFAPVSLSFRGLSGS